MTRTQREVETDIINVLRATTPGLSLGIGTPERKIVSAVAETISESYMDNYLTSQQWDIDRLSGLELESFVGLFGFGRFLGRRAVGTITFETTYAATENVIVPAGTQAYSSATRARSEIYFATTTTGIIPKGEFSVEIPAQAVQTGLSGNVGVGAINGFVAQFGLTGIANNSPFYGGLDAESDAQLRQRFKNTVLRNIAGTADFYRNMCLMHESVSKVKVVGPISRWEEQLQISDQEATSTITEGISKFTWPMSSVVSHNIGQFDEVFFTEFLHYTNNQDTVPTYSVLGGAIPDGWVVDVEHEYTSAASRNDPATGVMNKVDIFISGQDSVSTSDVSVMGDTRLNAVEGIYSSQNWERIDMPGSVASSSFLTILGRGPIVTFPETLLIKDADTGDTPGNTISYKDREDFALVRFKDDYLGSARGTYGIEWITKHPKVGTLMTIDYEYNRLPAVLDAIIAEKRQVTSDPLVRVANHVQFKVFIVVMYVSGFDPATVDSEIRARLADWFASLDFGSWIQMADIAQVVHNVQGVDNVRLRDVSIDGPGSWSVAKMENDEVTWGTVTDFKLRDDELPVFHSLQADRRSYNTYNPGNQIRW